MTLIVNIEEPRLVKQLDILDHRNQFLRELASIILTGHHGFESVWSIANRVYDRHYSPQAGLLNSRGVDCSERTALSA